MIAINSLLSSLLLLASISTSAASSAFSRGAVLSGGTSLFGIPRGGGLFGGNKYVSIVWVLVNRR